MNPYPPGAPMPQNPTIPHQSRRHQEYHQYQQHGPPHSPAPHNPYAYPYPPQYYGHPMPMPYQMPRWIPQQAYPPYAMQMPQHNGQRSPMVVNSQPHMPQSFNSRPLHYPQMPMQPPSPYSNPAAQSPALSQPVSSPREPPSQSSTPHPTSRRSSTVAQPPPAPSAVKREPFYPPLPWYSTPDAEADFPPRSRKRRRKFRLQKVNENVYIPERTQGRDEDLNEHEQISSSEGHESTSATVEEHTTDSNSARGAPPAEILDRTQTPSPTPPIDVAPPISNPANRSTSSKSTGPVIPALPQIAVPRSKPAQTNGAAPAESQQIVDRIDSSAQVNADSGEQNSKIDEDVAPQSPTKVIPKSWADLVRSKSSSAQNAVSNGAAPANGHANRSGTIGEVLNTFDVHQNHKIAFLEPRGLVNTGNMCYMNSVLQVLVFCIPFYDFLDQVGKRAAHSFKSDTPLVDAMIMFMREFRVIDSADSVEKLRLRLKDNELEQYGDPLIPEYVYGVINRLPRFSSMRRGHQQDAEEFLGFLLAGLHDECVSVMRSQGTLSLESPDVPTSPVSSTSQATDGWLEVGPKQKAAVTRQSGDPTASSPVTRIFGGALRSELRVPGLKNSVTLEPYQPLQLDIGSLAINNITEALKGLTKPENLVGDFHSPRGPGTSATKQIFIETLPPVLILHLKRFQYDSSGGTQKIWKRIGYPLEFEMPKEVFAPAKRGGMAMKGGLPRYRLNAVVYHHGKSAAGGHYTVDLLRQDRREWVRIDDTFIRRVRSEDVAEGGVEEDPKVLAKALERHQAEQEISAKRNPYEELDGEEEQENGGKAWSDVNGTDAKKRWAGVAVSAGTATPTSTVGKQTPRRDGVKDNKVAYILLYEKISP